MTKKKPGKPRTQIKTKQQGSALTSKPDRLVIIVPLVIVIFTLFLFWQAGKGQFLNWDDTEYVINNLNLRDLSWNGIVNIFSQYQIANYHPLTTLTWAIEYNLYGPNPAPYHWFNIFLHLINTLLVFLLSFRLTKSLLPAALVALLFGIHPMHVESVAWVSERKDVLYTLFFLAALVSYSKYLADRKQTKWYFIALVLFLFSLMSKSAAVVLPLVLLLFDYYYDRKFDKRAILEKAPFMLLSLLFGVIAYIAQQSVDAMNPLTDYNIIDRILFVIYAFVYYLISAIVPFELSAVHLYPEKTGNMLPWFYYAAPLVLVVIGALIYKAKPFRKELIFGFLFFMINIILVVQIIPLGRSMLSERYTYVPYIGLFVIFALGWKKFAGSNNRRNKTIFNSIAVFFILLIFTFSYITWNRVGVWNNSESLFRDVMKKYPRSYFGYYYTAFALYENNSYQEALPLFDRSIELYADDFDAWNNRGNVKYFMKDYEDALKDYSQAIKIFPEFSSAYHNRGSLYATIGKYPEAIADYSRALSIKPTYIEAYYNRGLVYNLQKDYDKAILDFSKAIELDPSLGKAYYDRGASKINMGSTDEGCSDMQQALGLGFQQAQNAMDQFCGKK